MSSFKDKLYQYETNPPANAWDKIVAALDGDNLEDKFPSALREMEVSPPAGVWDRINAELDTVSKKPATGVVRRIPLLRYAIAAAVIGAIAFAVVRLSTTGNDQSTLAGQTKISPDTIKRAEGQSNQIASDRIAETDITDNAPSLSVEQEKKLVARLDKTPRTRKSSVPNNSLSDPGNTLYTYDDHVPSIADRYIMIMTPDGSFFRMSKKWSNMVCCVSGEEQDADCKDQLKKWQEKLAQSSISSDNVLDMLTLVNTLNDGSDL